MLSELEHLVLIAQHRTFTEAARRAHLSQPALTAAVRRLEDHFGAKLFHRGRHGAELTVAGRALLPRAKAALAAVEDGRRAVAEVVGLHTGQVTVGAGATACTYLLPPLLARFREQHPNVRIRLREAFTERLLNRLQEGRIDLAIITGPGDDLWLKDDLILVTAPDIDHRKLGYVTFSEGSPTRDLLLHHFPGAEIVMELGSIAAVKGNVRAGIGKALVSRAAAANDLEAGTLVEIRSRKTPIVRELSLVHRGVDRLPPAAAALRDLLLA
jgi:DNA-binding transcriptional LysR family regulator